MEIELTVGSKGELFLPKRIREELGFSPGDHIIAEIKNNRIIIRKIHDLLDLLHTPIIEDVEKLDTIKDDIHRKYEEQLKLSLDEHNNE